MGVIDGRPDDEVFQFRRSSSSEVALAAALSFVAVSNVDAFYDKKIYTRQMHHSPRVLWSHRSSPQRLWSPFSSVVTRRVPTLY